MRDLWRVSGTAVALIVLLRLAIGWQFIYEGLWKLNTFSTSKPWTAAGYLRNARGPMRNVYRSMTGDPDDLSWLDYDAVAARLDAYKAAFLAHHPDLTDEQKSKLDEMLDGPASFSAPLAKLPDGVKFEGGLAKVVSYDPESKRLIVDGKQHLLPKERAELVKMSGSAKGAGAGAGATNGAAKGRGGAADPAVVQRFIRAVDQVYKQSAKLSFKERLQVLLKIDPDRVGVVYHNDKTNETLVERKGQIPQYKEMLARYEVELPRIHETFERQHLDAQWEEIQKLRAELVNPVRALETELKQESRRLLTGPQLSRGPVPEPWTPQRIVDHLTIWALIGLGCLLMIGFFSRTAAFAAAGMLLTFYLAVPPPPWPGVEELIETAGPEHSFLVNKNLIEVIGLLAIVSLPTGQWFGLDGLLTRLTRRKRVVSVRTPSAAPSS